MSYHILYHIIYYTISYHIISYHIISYIIYHIISYISYHILYHIIYYTISYHIISYHIIYHISYHIIYIISYIIPYNIIEKKTKALTFLLSDPWFHKLPLKSFYNPVLVWGWGVKLSLWTTELCCPQLCPQFLLRNTVE